MAGPGGGQKGVVDGLTNTFTDISKMMLLPDAPQHMQFLQGLQQGIMAYIRQQANATLQPPGGAMGGMGGPGGGPGGQPMGGPGGGMGGPGGPPMGGNPGGPGAPQGMRNAPGGGGGMTGLMGAAGQASPDDLRRLLAQGAQS